MSKSDQSFAEKFAELDELVAWFDSEDVDVDEALKKFERGMELSKELRKHLEETQNKVEKIKADFS